MLGYPMRRFIPELKGGLVIALCTAVLTGCLSQADYESRLVGNWKGGQANTQWCITYNSDQSLVFREYAVDEFLKQTTMPPVTRMMLTTDTGHWEVKRGGRLTLVLNKTRKMPGLPEPRSWEETTKYFVRGFSGDRAEFRPAPNGADFFGSRIDSCADWAAQLEQ